MSLNHLFKLSAIRSLLLTCIAVMLFSFSNRKAGGDVFTIYFGEKLLLREMVRLTEPIKTISLPISNDGDALKVHYSHCGKIGLDRKLSIRDNQKKTLKSWSYGEGDDMLVSIKELKGMKMEDAIYDLVYTSIEIPDGKVLTHVVFTGDAQARLQ